MRAIPPWLFRMFDLFRWADDRQLPVAGGVLDQTASFMQALRVYRTAHAEWDELKK